MTHSTLASARKPRERDYPDRLREFRAALEASYWRDRAIRVAVGLDAEEELREDFADEAAGCEGAGALEHVDAIRLSRAAFEKHGEAAANYCGRMAARLGWLARQGAPRAALEGAARKIDADFGSPLAPGDSATESLHFGAEAAERQRVEWERVVARFAAKNERRRA